MRPTSGEQELLRVLASMPFLDRLELAAITGRSRGAAFQGVRRLEQRGYAASFPHATGLVPPTRRCYLTAAGLRRLAQGEEGGLDALLSLHPVSAAWRRILLERLDALAVIYRLAAAVSNAAFPIRFRWYRASPLDAAITLPCGVTLGVLRLGHTADRTGFAKRVWRLGQGPLPGAVLALVPDEVRLRHARRLLGRTPVPALLSLEGDAALAGAGHRIWQAPAVNAVLDLRYLLERLQPGGALPEEVPPSTLTVPGDDGMENAPHVRVGAAGKRALDLLFDWPWISRRDLAALLGVSEPRASQLIAPMEDCGLAGRPSGAGGRLALTDKGLALLARRDRASVGAARRRWSVVPLDPQAPLDWRNVAGGRSRQLLRNLEHTSAVHSFLAAVTRQSHSLDWEVVQLDPPARASRHFRHDGKLRSVHPDAFGVLRRGPVTWPFFLEWERRAVRPSTMAARLAPYLRYYSSHRPADDHGVRPAVLVVFDDEIASSHFLQVAQRKTRGASVSVPLWVSHRGAIETLGPLGPAWRTPGDWEPARPFL